ncbi:hypothetical protein BVY01_04830 [bacterium I07]|nr:hypothetical protein BVY01_04830 [bacterium I07]
MSNSGKSVFVFGIYLVVLGLGFLICPNFILNIFGIPETAEPWIRVMAMLLLFLAYYDVQAARSNFIDFFKWSVSARSSVIVFFLIFVLLDIAPPILILFGVIDLIAALWTAFELRRENPSGT